MPLCLIFGLEKRGEYDAMHAQKLRLGPAGQQRRFQCLGQLHDNALELRLQNGL